MVRVTFQLPCGGWVSNAIYRQKTGLASCRRVSTRQRRGFGSQSYNSGKSNRAAFNWAAKREKVAQNPFVGLPVATVTAERERVLEGRAESGGICVSNIVRSDSQQA